MGIINRYLELRSICLFEPETEEFVQLTYLCDIDFEISTNQLLDSYGSLRSIGIAKDKSFMQLGVFPVAIRYERQGHLKRAHDNFIDDIFEHVSKNIYRPNKNGISLLCRMKHLRMKEAAA